LAGPLEGIRVVDISAILSGPLATMMLADQGADVIKVERPGIGDLMRIGPFRDRTLSAFYANANRGKRAVALDIGDERGREVLIELVRDADVFVQNFRPGAVERLNIGAADLHAINPNLIYVSISGYGPTGPYSDRRVYDPIIQGITGHVAIQQNPDVPIPDLVRNVIADKASAYTAAQAITAALFARERGAGGQHIEIPMIDASLAFFWPDGMMAHTMLGENITPGPTLYEVYRLTETADGHLIYFAASNDEFHALLRALDRADLCEDSRYNTALARENRENLAALGEILYNEFRKWKTEEILERMVAEQVPVGPVNDLDGVLADPQVLHNDRILSREHPEVGTIRQCRPAARFDKTPTEDQPLPPLLGEHTDDVLGEFGIDEARRAALREAGVIL
jgi:crotonobetainyl-CoA:carnitine CoA-transferase CaiB-like acyl-CoA transferase